MFKNLVAVSAAIAALFGITTLILVVAGFRPLPFSGQLARSTQACGIRETNTPSSFSAVMQGDANKLSQDVKLSRINYVGGEILSIHDFDQQLTS